MHTPSSPITRSRYLCFFSLGFEPEQNETGYLKRRLREEKAKTAKADRARREAEERCIAAERERVSYSNKSCIVCSAAPSSN